MKKFPFRRWVVIVLILVLTPFAFYNLYSRMKKSKAGEMKTQSPEKLISLKQDTTIRVGRFDVSILIPEGKTRASMLVLPGWNFGRMDWCTHTSLCAKAKSQGYVLILPEMGKSLYSSGVFPETENEFRKYPTRTWLTDTMILFVRNHFSLLLPGENNFIVGLSTGGRGVALTLAHTENIFRAAAALSGDFDQTLEPGEPLCNKVYGSIKKFPERWTGEDNPAYMISKINVPIFLAHGKADAVVPFIQTDSFFHLLKKTNQNQAILFSPPDAGHNWLFWSSCVDSVYQFFEKNLLPDH